MPLSPMISANMKPSMMRINLIEEVQSYVFAAARVGARAQCAGGERWRRHVSVARGIELDARRAQPLKTTHLRLHILRARRQPRREEEPHKDRAEEKAAQGEEQPGGRAKATTVRRCACERARVASARRMARLRE